MLQSSGAISLNDVSVELLGAGGNNTLRSLNDASSRTLAGIPTGLISLSNFYGKSNVVIAVGRGYFAGGNNSTTTIDCMQFDLDLTIYLTAVLSESRYNLAGANSSTKGYWGGGYYNTTDVAIIGGFTFSTEATNDSTASLSVPRSWLGAVNSSTKGYWAGGALGVSSGTMLADIDGILFSNETAINPAAVISYARTYLSGVNSTTNGFFGGGVGPASTFTSIIDKLNFSTEASSVSTVGFFYNALSRIGVNSSTKGYWAGGISYESGQMHPSASIEGIQFSTETKVSVSAYLAAERYMHAGVNSNISGYWGSGTAFDGTMFSASTSVHGLQFGTETAFVSAATLLAREGLTGVQSGSL